MRLIFHLTVRIVLFSCAVLWLWTQQDVYPFLIISLSIMVSLLEFGIIKINFISNNSDHRKSLLACSLVDPLTVALLVPQLFASTLLAGFCVGGILLMIVSLGYNRHIKN